MSVVQAQIVALATRRIPPVHIAKTLCIPVDQVYSGIRRARSQGVKIPYFRTRNNPPPERSPGSQQIAITMRLNTLLVAEAERRKRTPSETAQILLEQALLEGWSRNGRQ